MSTAPNLPKKSPLRRARSAVRRAINAGSDLKKRVSRRVHRPNLYDMGSGERLGVVITAPSEMTVTERIFLYGLVRGARPKRILEIGTHHGGSAAIMCAALEDASGFKGKKHVGIMVGIDPIPLLEVPESAFFGRFSLVAKPSPEGIPEAARVAGGKFDFALIDGIHIYDQVIKDVEGTLPHFDVGGYLLFHDAFHYGVSEAIARMLEKYPQLHDCGYPCARPAMDVAAGEVAYGGFRMLRLGAPVVDPHFFIEAEAAGRGVATPLRDPDLLNHDKAWLCRVGEPCAYCKKQRAKAASAG